MQKVSKIIRILVALIIILGSGGYLKDDLKPLYERLRMRVLRLAPELREITTRFADISLDQLKKEINAPPPLRVVTSLKAGTLTRAGAIQSTNIARTKNGLTSLSENTQLNSAATLKLRDMFEKQYFAHVSPQGNGPSYFVEQAGYTYVMIGENLALGNFENDQELVEAWMGSPGHRENILNPRYQEIGIAVGQGIFEGERTWLAVQVFGLPSSACPQPNEDIRSRITANEQQLNAWQSELEKRRAELEQMEREGSSRREEYRQKVSEYNALVEKYNSLIIETKELMNTYNRQVTSFNNCVKG